MMSITRCTTYLLLALMTLGAGTNATAGWQAEPGNRLEQRAAQAVQRIGSKVERSQPYFESAYAYAIWPGITRVALGFGGAYGKGVVVEQNTAVGTVGYWQFSSGIQGGAKYFAMIIFFKDEAALEGLKKGKMQFTGQAGIDIGTVGVAGTPAYSDGIAIIPLTNFGLMAEFSAAGVKFNFKPYRDAE